MKLRSPAMLLLAVAVLFTTGVVLLWTGLWDGMHTQPRHPSSTAASTADAPVPAIDHVVIIMEENKSRQAIVGNADAPYLNSLMRTYATATHYSGVTHPSLPNYIALTAGTTAGINSDCTPGSHCQAAVTNISDVLEQSGRTWKAYMEDMPAPCTATNDNLYAVRHNPFMYYPGVRDNTERCNQHVVPFTRLGKDLAALPDYTFISPNLCNDMHNCSVKTGDQWLAAHVPTILASPAFTKQHSLLVIVWDEDENRGANNEVAIVFVGPAAKRGYTATTPYDHYSLLHTIESALNVPPLTINDRQTRTMAEMLQ